MLPDSVLSRECSQVRSWPVVARDALDGPVLGGVKRPEALVEAGGVEGRAQAGCDDAGHVGAVR